MSYQNNAVPSAVSPVSPVTRALGEIDEAIDAVRNEADRIEGKVARVTTPPAETAGNKLQGIAPTSCELEAVLVGYAERIRYLAGRLSSLSDRIAL